MAELGYAMSFNKPIIPILSPQADFNNSVPDFLKNRLIINAKEMQSYEITAAVFSVLKRTEFKYEKELLAEKIKRKQRLKIVATVCIILILISIIIFYIF